MPAMSSTVLLMPPVNPCACAGLADMANKEGEIAPKLSSPLMSKMFCWSLRADEDACDMLFAQN